MTKNTHYELTFIIDGNIADNEHTEIFKKVKDLLLENKAEIISEIELGRKKLSYSINKSQKGNYFSIEFNVDANLLKTLSNKLKLEKGILRFLMIKKPADAINKPIEEKSEEKKKSEKPAKEKKAKIEKIEQPKKEEVKIETEEKESVKEEKTDNKIEKDELDEKLDEILNKESF